MPAHEHNLPSFELKSQLNALLISKDFASARALVLPALEEAWWDEYDEKTTIKMSPYMKWKWAPLMGKADPGWDWEVEVGKWRTRCGPRLVPMHCDLPPT